MTNRQAMHVQSVTAHLQWRWLERISVYGYTCLVTFMSLFFLKYSLVLSKAHLSSSSLNTKTVLTESFAFASSNLQKISYLSPDCGIKKEQKEMSVVLYGG